MRIIAIGTLKSFWTHHKSAEGSLRAWYQEVNRSSWNNSGQLKQQFKNASILNSKRVVFNIKGNSYRLIADVEFRLQIIFVVWIGTHDQYNEIDATKITYNKANKK